MGGYEGPVPPVIRVDTHEFKEGGPADAPDLCRACYEPKSAHVTKPVETVDHSSHYNQYKGLEVIDLVEQMNFNRGNAVNYIATAGFKRPETTVEDLKKARWYLDREIQRLEGGVSETNRNAFIEEARNLGNRVSRQFQ